jgi:glycosyltransferase involved in cell wall biosynthesis
VDAFIVLANEFKNKLLIMGCSAPIYLGSTAIDHELLTYSTDRYLSRITTNEQFNILFLSRIEKEKGIMEALKSFLILKEKIKNINFIIAGDGSALDDAKHFVSDNNMDRVHFLGYVEVIDKSNAFRSSHCYLFPSYSEGMPISVLEAMAFGLPVITRNVGALSDFFENGMMGYMNESNNPEIIAFNIERLFYDPVKCDQISRYNEKYAKEHFISSSVVEKLESIYSEVVNRK